MGEAYTIQCCPVTGEPCRESECLDNGGCMQHHLYGARWGDGPAPTRPRGHDWGWARDPTGFLRFVPHTALGAYPWQKARVANPPVGTTPRKPNPAAVVWALVLAFWLVGALGFLGGLWAGRLGV